MQCKCGCQDGEYKQGVSKKNNKPWKGWKCTECGEMSWIKTEKTATSQTPDNSVVPILEEMKALLCAINAKLGGQAPKVEKTVKKAKKDVELDQDGFPLPNEEEAPF